MMAIGSTPRSSSFLAGVRYMRALARLSERGESQTAKGHVLRTQLEGLWYELPEEEQDLLDSLSADLRSLVEQPPPGPEPTDQEKNDLAAAISAASWMEVLALLRECPRLSQGVDGAQLRAQCWRAAGVNEIAAEFYGQAKDLLERSTVVTVMAGVIATRRRELNMPSGARRRSVRPLLGEGSANTQDAP
jgi:hypothetical protein